MGRLDPRLECFLRLPPTRHVAKQFWSLKATFSATGGQEQRIRVFVRLAQGSGLGTLRRLEGVHVRTEVGELCTAEATAAGLEALRVSPSVLYVEAARPLTPTSATAATAGPKLELPSGPLPQAGRNVVIGVVDWGCDFTHEDFRRADGSTRLHCLWDQGATVGQIHKPPNGYSVGVEVDANALNEALRAIDPFASAGVRPPGRRAHGTHVLGIAAGNGRAAPDAGVCGMAPEADIIFVQPDTGDVEITGGFGDSVNLAEAVQYIFQKAAALRRPAVINLSMGTNSGPHDGTTLVEQWIDSLLTVPGRAIVMALGNEHHERYNRTHSEGNLKTGEHTTLYWRVLANDRSPNEMEIWYSGRDLFEAEIELPNGSRLPIAAPGTSRVDPIDGGRAVVYQANMLHSPLNGDNQINIIVVAEAGQAITSGVWQVHLCSKRSRDGGFDAWIERDAMGGSARMSSFLGGSYVRRKTLGSIQSARLAITVSNYDAMTTTLADSTSFGPTRDGRRAPVVAAPGVDIQAARSLWQSDSEDPTPYVAMTGTSMSAPYVAGLVACMLEKNPALTAMQIRGILAACAQPAPGFSDEWRNDWGNGRVDPVDTLAATPAYTPPDAQPRALGLGGRSVYFEADVCVATHPHAEGPFYRPGSPETLDLYPDDSTGPVLHFEGTISDEACRPLSDVSIEVWQADDHGRYDNNDPANPPRDDYFRCRGRLHADATGRFKLRTVLPANYKVDPAGEWVRVKHLHLKLYRSGFVPLTTEIALLPDAYTDTDHLYDPALAAELRAGEGSVGREWHASFAFVLVAASTRAYATTVLPG